jgi:RNA polymerase sigma-70 factor (ECF subfamily)
MMLYLALLETQSDKDKFEALYYRYHRLMLFVANEILHDESLAQDAVQEAFLRIITNFGKIEDVTCHKIKSFVVIVVENVAKRMYTQMHKRKVLSFDEIEYEISDDGTELDELLSRFSVEVILKNIKALAPEDGDIFLLKYDNGLTDKEIADVLSLNYAAVRKRLERARKRLALLLEKEGFQL